MKDLQETGLLLNQISSLIETSRAKSFKSINSLHVFLCYQIGEVIVEFEQKGKNRAEYARKTLKNLSDRLTVEYGQGFSTRNLRNMRQFYLEYKNSLSRIRQTLSAKSFKLSWSHYVLLSGITKNEERHFYEIEAINSDWSLRELRRQVNSALYERLTVSRHKKEVRELAEKGHILSKPQDAVKDPYILEFLGLKEDSSYSENKLETVIIDKLEYFLLELGKGFLFEARQKRFSFDETHFFVDLVFYNRLLRCYVLIDLKIDKLTHQDLGQMQMYVNYFDRYVKTEEEMPTIGIVLCKEKSDIVVELTLLVDSNIYASKYQLYLPSKEDFIKQIEEAGEEVARYGR